MTLRFTIWWKRCLPALGLNGFPSGQSKPGKCSPMPSPTRLIATCLTHQSPPWSRTECAIFCQLEPFSRQLEKARFYRRCRLFSDTGGEAERYCSTDCLVAGTPDPADESSGLVKLIEPAIEPVGSAGLSGKSIRNWQKDLVSVDCSGMAILKMR